MNFSSRNARESDAELRNKGKFLYDFNLCNGFLLFVSIHSLLQRLGSVPYKLVSLSQIPYSVESSAINFETSCAICK